MVEKKEPQLPPGLKAAIEAFAKVPNLNISFPAIDLSGIVKARENALAAFPEIQRQFAEHSKHVAEVQRQLAKIRLPSEAVMQQMAEAAKRMQSVYGKFPPPSPEQLKLFEQLAC
jgi:hypothetical protein